MRLIDKCRVLNFAELGDERGHLVVAESEKDIPFNIKRFLYLWFRIVGGKRTACK